MLTSYAVLHRDHSKRDRTFLSKKLSGKKRKKRKETSGGGTKKCPRDTGDAGKGASLDGSRKGKEKRKELLRGKR